MFIITGCKSQGAGDVSNPSIIDEREARQKTADTEYIRKNYETNISTVKLENNLDLGYYYYNRTNYSTNMPAKIKTFVAAKKISTRKNEVESTGRAFRYMSLILESSVMDIYVDISTPKETNVRASSVEFGENNWRKLLNTFSRNIKQFKHTYGDYSIPIDGVDRGKLTVVFTDMPSKIINGYYDSFNFKEYDEYGENIPARNIIHLNYKLLESGDSDKVEEMLFYELQHLVNYTEQKNLGGSTVTEVWVNNMLSESTYYLLRGNSLSSNASNTMSKFDSEPTIVDGYYFTQWEHNENYSHITLKMFTYWTYLHFFDSDFDTYNIFRLIAKGRSTSENRHTLSYKQIESAFEKVNSKYSSWYKIFTDWAYANVKNNATGIYGYKNNINFTPRCYTDGKSYELGTGKMKAEVPFKGAIYIKLANIDSVEPTDMWYYGSNRIVSIMNVVDSKSKEKYNIYTYPFLENDDTDLWYKKDPQVYLKIIKKIKPISSYAYSKNDMVDEDMNVGFFIYYDDKKNLDVSITSPF